MWDLFVLLTPAIFLLGLQDSILHSMTVLCQGFTLLLAEVAETCLVASEDVFTLGQLNWSKRTYNICAAQASRLVLLVEMQRASLPPQLGAIEFQARQN